MNSAHPDTSFSSDILIVDDTPANLRLLAGMLTARGYKVRSAPNGKLALMAAQAAPPDLILLDITMPGISGYEVCEQLKAADCTRDIPVIFISALDQIEDKVKAFTLGGVDYITKPFQIEEVLARVGTHLALHTLQRQLAAANAELRAANQELAASNADLHAFAHTVAHDLKSPLSAVIGFSTLMESRLAQLSPERVAENLHHITETGHKMQSIIEALLLFASVRQSDEVTCMQIEMGAVVREVLTRLAPEIEAVGAKISFPETWPAVWSYAPWLEEVWANYISNALKYGGDAGRGIAPCVELGAETASLLTSGTRFSVRDNGSGLAPNEVAQVFTPFTRFHHARAAGHGLGLSIVQRIVEKLGGLVGVESAGPGQGSRFWFELPAQ